ncbi:MAG: hypothetical protein FWD25_10755 [Clostridia bacterium]|nr:hypothetical protein [Clostridia bacterium]
MRVLAWALLVITIFAGLLIAYSLYAAELRVTQAQVRVAPAAEMATQFQGLYRAVQERAVLGKQFQEGPTDDPDAYDFHIYTVHLRNNGLVPADWVRLDVLPEPGAVLQSESESAGYVPAVSPGEIQLVVLAQRGASPARQLSLTYFIWGRSYNLPVVVSE